MNIKTERWYEDYEKLTLTPVNQILVDPTCRYFERRWNQIFEFLSNGLLGIKKGSQDGGKIIVNRDGDEVMREITQINPDLLALNGWLSLAEKPGEMVLFSKNFHDDYWLRPISGLTVGVRNGLLITGGGSFACKLGSKNKKGLEVSVERPVQPFILSNIPDWINLMGASIGEK